MNVKTRCYFSYIFIGKETGNNETTHSLNYTTEFLCQDEFLTRGNLFL